MKKRLYQWLVMLCLVLLGQGGKALHAQAPQTIEVGPHIGISNYIGDINPCIPDVARLKVWKMFNQFDLSYGGLVRYNYNTRWSFRLDFTHGVIKGTDTIAGYVPERGLSFRTVVNDLSLVGEFNFLDYYTGHMSDVISPYIFAGVSVCTYTTGFLAPGATEDGHSLLSELPVAFTIPFGVGCKMSLTDHLAATVEWKMHWTNSDQIDGVTGVYPSDDEHDLLVATPTGLQLVTGDPNTIILQQENYDDYHPVILYDYTDPTGQYHEGMQRGNSQTRDLFGFLNVSLTWKFNVFTSNACKIMY